MQLFAHHAARARPDFAVTAENAAAIAAICIRLDGLPLALELAAARTTVLAPAQLLERLEYRLPMLVGGAARFAGPPEDTPRHDRLEL